MKSWLLSLSITFVVTAAAFAQKPMTREEMIFAGIDPDAHVPVTLAGPSPAYGTASDSAVRVSAVAFTPRFGVYVIDGNGGGERHGLTTVIGGTTVNTDNFWDAPLILPSGAKITAVRAEYCDTNAAQDVTLFLLRSPEPSDGLGTSAITSFSSAGTPGCTFTTVDISALNVTFDPVNFSTWLRFRMDALDGTLRLRGAVVYYRLQVSPAPLTATFNDVPTTHPFFQYIEALADAGITGGCVASPPQYCPDAPITRGQMAVFLSRALGLHWVP